MNDLKTKTCKELREIAKGFEIKGRWDMTKDELINRTWQDALAEFYDIFMNRYREKALGLSTGYSSQKI